LSDASVPGEGEHKIMDFIRRQRNRPEYDPNTHHVLYGLDADLIMLALATHEPYFKILREDVFFQEGKDKGCFICGQVGHYAVNCTGKAKEKVGEFDEKTKAVAQKPFVFLHVPILREYLEVELSISDLGFEYSLERALDDWVFMCFFVGNDFLPHLPSLEIREGAIDTLITLWKKNLRQWGGFLTDSGQIDLGRVEQMMENLGNLEDQVFQKRREIEERRRLGRIARAKEQKERQGLPTYNKKPQEDVPEIVKRVREQPQQKPSGATLNDNKAAAELLKASLLGQLKQETVIVTTQKKRKSDVLIEEEMIEKGVSITVLPASEEASPVEDTNDPIADVPVVTEVFEDDIPEDITVPIPKKEKEKKKFEEEEEQEPEDNVRLWESGWKERYYKNKFSVDLDDEKFKKNIVAAYVEGLCWVLQYYYQGVQSWKWYYPYHYSPFASDFKQVESLKINFELGIPFKPIEQLMGVLPAASKSHIPRPLHFLMEDESSPILDFYPVDFPMDMNGKKHEWQGVALLPFIDEERLLKAIEPIYKELHADETTRNTIGNEVITVSASAKVFDYLCSVYAKRANQEPLSLSKKQGSYFDGLVSPYADVCLPGSTFFSPLTHLDQDSIDDNQSITTCYSMPVYPSDYIFKAKLLKGVRLPTPVLEEFDKRDVLIGFKGRNAYGRRGNHNGGYNNIGQREAAGRFIK
jgi:5'-3' exoribonuclease 2